MRRGAAIAVVVIVLVACVIAVGRMRRAQPPAAPTSAVVSATVVPAPESTRQLQPDTDTAATVATSSAASRLPTPAATAPPPGAFETRLSGLERAATGGDPRAAADFGELLASCHDYVSMSAQQIEDSIVTGLAADEPPPLIGGKPVTAELLILLLQEWHKELERHCAGSEGIIDMERARPALDWLQRAADAGEVAAMTSYAREVLVGAPSDGYSAGDAQARRQRGLDYLERAVAAGDARALQLRAELHTQGIVVAVDPVAAYADIYVFARTSLGRQWPPRLIELYLQALAQPLDAAQLAQAQRNGEALWQACCAATAR